MSLDETPFQESSSPLRAVILFVPSTSCREREGENLPPFRPTTCTADRKLVEPVLLSRSPSQPRIISNSRGPFSRFENGIKKSGRMIERERAGRRQRNANSPYERRISVLFADADSVSQRAKKLEGGRREYSRIISWDNRLRVVSCREILSAAVRKLAP